MSDLNPQGGDLFDMAKEGTKVPEDAAKPNIILSVASDAQKKKGAPGLSGEMDNNSISSTGLGEVVSAGGEIPEDVGQKYSMSGGKERGEKPRAPLGGRNH
ncbi:hypothetical protein B0H63DRAFT_485813 [Podospora didyma]|uniref:Uncharacterized protein n=1 Tax=Podospora didyma TaxID=330526 RepID=A0AAE0K4L5_9PEZI|nr:hypothetical protein B0H63DRAFT_485813 [Podospora didyma]